MMTWKTPDKNWLLENLVDLILDETITSAERDIFVSNKTQLEKSQNDHAVAASLKSSLSRLAVEQQLTSASTQFLVELSQRYIGANDMGGRDVLFSI